MAQLGLVVAAFVLTLAALELGLRMFWDGFYLKNPRIYRQPHATRGWENIPLATVEWGDPEFSVLSIHDEDGFRIPAAGAARGERDYKVVALGDSMAYGVGVQGDETFSARIEEMDPTVRVVNMGVPGYSTSQELLMLREVGFSEDPDLVVVLFLWNDVPDSFYPAIPRFAVEGGELVYDPPGPAAARPKVRPKPVRHPWLSHLYTYRFVSDRLKIARNWIKVQTEAGRYSLGLLKAEDVDAAWELEHALVAEMYRECQERRVDFLLAIIPDAHQVYPDWSSGLADYDYEVQERMLAFTRKQGIPTLDLLPGLREAAQRRSELLYHRFDRHWAPAGHDAAARLILAEIQRLRRRPQPSAPASASAAIRSAP